jgi:hypothetical protein
MLTFTKENTFQNTRSMGYSRRKIGFSIDNLWEPKKKKYFPGRRRIMSPLNPMQTQTSS